MIAGAVLVANALFPVVSDSTDAQSFTETIEKTSNSSVEQNTTLQKASDGLDIEDGSLSFTSLTEGNNYSIDYDTGVVTFNNTGAGNFTADYNYFEAAYVDDSGERAIFDLVMLFGIIGLIYFAGRGFGLL